MSILGVIVRARTDDAATLRERLTELVGVDVALDPGDGRLILVIEDAPGRAAAASLAEISQWPIVINTSLVYEHSGADVSDSQPEIAEFSDWRSSLSAAHRGRPLA
jgi:periplasmic nitrate reductase NapD